MPRSPSFRASGYRDPVELNLKRDQIIQQLSLQGHLSLPNVHDDPATIRKKKRAILRYLPMHMRNAEIQDLLFNPVRSIIRDKYIDDEKVKWALGYENKKVTEDEEANITVQDEFGQDDPPIKKLSITLLKDGYINTYTTLHKLFAYQEKRKIQESHMKPELRTLPPLQQKEQLVFEIASHLLKIEGAETHVSTELAYKYCCESADYFEERVEKNYEFVWYEFLKLKVKLASELTDDGLKAAQTTNRLAEVLEETGQYDLAMEYYEKLFSFSYSKDWETETKEKSQSWQAYFGIQRIARTHAHSSGDSSPEIVSLFRKVKRYAQKIQYRPHVALAAVELAEALFFNNELAEAQKELLPYVFDSLTEYSDFYAREAYFNLQKLQAYILEHEKKPEEAIEKYHVYLEYAKETENHYGVFEVCLCLGRLFITCKKDDKKGATYMKEAWQMIQPGGVLHKKVPAVQRQFAIGGYTLARALAMFPSFLMALEAGGTEQERMNNIIGIGLRGYEDDFTEGTKPLKALGEPFDLQAEYRKHRKRKPTPSIIELQHERRLKEKHDYIHREKQDFAKIVRNRSSAFLAGSHKYSQPRLFVHEDDSKIDPELRGDTDDKFDGSPVPSYTSDDNF